MRTSLFAPSWGDAFGSSSTPTRVKVSASSRLTLPSMTPRNLPPLLKKRGKPDADLSASLEYLRNIIEVVTPELYAVFESEARQRLRGRDESDWPILATALGLACALWTEDADFFGTGVAVWTTNRIEIFLKGQAQSHESQVRMNDVEGRRDLSNDSNYDHTRLNGSLPDAFTVAKVPKHEIICLNRYYRTNHIQRICTWSGLVEEDGAKPVRN